MCSSDVSPVSVEEAGRSVSGKRSDSRAKGQFRSISCWEEVDLQFCVISEPKGSNSIFEKFQFYGVNKIIREEEVEDGCGSC